MEKVTIHNDVSNRLVNHAHPARIPMALTIRKSITRFQGPSFSHLYRCVVQI